MRNQLVDLNFSQLRWIHYENKPLDNIKWVKFKSKEPILMN